MKRTAIAFALAGLMVAPLAAQDSGLPPGTKAPAVVINDLDGKPTDLAAIIGTKPIVLEFWATWCTVCEELMPRVEAAHAAYGDRVAFYGINVTVNQTKDRVRRYLLKHHPPFITLYDEKGVSIRAYDVPGTAHVVIIDGAGKVAYAGTGADQDLVGELKKIVGK